jgi:hypothetical protein
MTIVAASIPILRHLFRREKSTARGTGEGASKVPSYVNQSMRLRSLSKGEYKTYVKPADEESILDHGRSQE